MVDHQSNRRTELVQQFSSFLEEVENRNSELMAEIQEFRLSHERDQQEIRELKLARDADQKEISQLKLTAEKTQAEVIHCKKAFMTLKSCLSEEINANPLFNNCDLDNSEHIDSFHAITNGSVGGARSFAASRDVTLSDLTANSSIANTEESGGLATNDATPSTTGTLSESVSNSGTATPVGNKDGSGDLPTMAPIATTALLDLPPAAAIAKRPRGRPPKKTTDKTPQAATGNTKETPTAQNSIKQPRGRPPSVNNNGAARTLSIVPLKRSHSLIGQTDKALASESPKRRVRPRKDASSPAIVSSDVREADGNSVKQISIRVHKLGTGSEVNSEEITTTQNEKEASEAKAPVSADHSTGKEDETGANKTPRKRGRPPKSSKAQVDSKCLPSSDHPDVSVPGANTSHDVAGESCDSLKTVAPAKKRGRPPKASKTAENVSVSVNSVEAPLDTPKMICPGSGSLVPPVAVSCLQDSPEVSQAVPVVVEIHVDKSAPSLEEPVAKRMKETEPEQLPIIEDERKESISEEMSLNLELPSIDMAIPLVLN